MRRWAMVVLAATIASSPVLVSYVQNEVWASRQLDALAPPLPPHTSVIKETVGGAGRHCTELVTQVLATTLPFRRVASFVAGRTSRPLDVAWSAPDGFYAFHAQEATRVEERSLPPPVHKLLTTYFLLPQGVHPLVVYREAPLPHRLDPRCWGST